MKLVFGGQFVPAGLRLCMLQLTALLVRHACRQLCNVPLHTCEQAVCWLREVWHTSNMLPCCSGKLCVGPGQHTGV